MDTVSESCSLKQTPLFFYKGDFVKQQRKSSTKQKEKK